METIPLHKCCLSGRESQYVAEAIASGHLASDGPFTLRCAQLLEQRLGLQHVLMTSSCTSALELAASLCRLEPGDEVILPSFTFVSTANAFLRLGARPVFVDIDPETLNVDPRFVERALTTRTKVLCPIHYAGVACDLPRVMELAATMPRVLVVEDAAQAVNAFVDGRALGGIGHLGAFSFHDTKNFACGEGGALCVNDPSLVERADILRDKGTNRRQFLRGQSDKYTWVDIGSSPIPSELSCAFLAAQLEQMDFITAQRRRIHETYVAQLRDLELAGHLRLPVIPANRQSNYHLFYILLRTSSVRDSLQNYLKERGIQSAFHYVPLHSSPLGRQFGYAAGDLPVTEDRSGRLLRLPLHLDLSPERQQRVIDAVRAFLSTPQARREPDRARGNVSPS